jgi:sensor histidine kinase regulating citrate/malate metabolism
LILLSGVGTVIILTLEEELSQKACLFIGGTFLSLDFMVFFLYETLISNAQKEKDQIFLLEQTKAYEQLITDSRENDRKIRSLRHDMKNHLAEIGELARLGKTDEILQYIGYAARELADATPQVSTGVVGLDGILNYKIREAAANGILVKKKIAVPDSVGISAYEMNIIIGNLLDNAIRAVTEIEGDNRLISILIRYEKRVLYIRIENACDETKIVDYRGRLISTKNESDQSHGIGIMNVKRTVDKMNGMFTTEHGEGFFIATVIIPEKT